MKLRRKTEAVDITRLTALFYGQPGTGKTSLTAELSDNTLLVDVNRGSYRAVGNAAITAEITTWKEVEAELMNPQSLAQLRNEEGIDTIAIDTAEDMLVRFIGEYEYEINPRYRQQKYQMQWYGAIGKRFQRCYYMMVDAGFNVVFVCHQREEKQLKGDRETLFLKPELTGKSYSLLMSMSDLVGFVYKENEKRYLSFDGDFHYGKNCANFPVMEIPDALSDYEAFKTFSRSLLPTALSRINSETEDQRKFREAKEKEALELQEVKEYWSEKLEAVTDAAGMTEFNKENGGLIAGLKKPHQEIVRQLTRDRLKGIGVTYNSEQAAFVDTKPKEAEGATIEENLTKGAAKEDKVKEEQAMPEPDPAHVAAFEAETEDDLTASEQEWVSKVSLSLLKGKAEPGWVAKTDYEFAKTYMETTISNHMVENGLMSKVHPDRYNQTLRTKVADALSTLQATQVNA